MGGGLTLLTGLRLTSRHGQRHFDGIAHHLDGGPGQGSDCSRDEETLAEQGMLEMLQEVFGPSFADHVSFICPAQSFGSCLFADHVKFYLPCGGWLFLENWLAKYVQ